MDNTSRELRRVHVAQPAFLASELLSVGIENFMQAGVTSPRLLFLASKRVVIDHEEFFDKRFLKQIAEVRHDFKAHHDQLGINPSMSVKRLGSGALRFQIMPLDRAEFHATIDELDVLPQSEHCEQHFIGPQLHFLQATIAGHLLASKEDMERAGRMLRERLAEPTSGSLYTVRAHDIVDGMTEIPAIARNPSTPNTL